MIRTYLVPGTWYDSSLNYACNPTPGVLGEAHCLTRDKQGDENGRLKKRLRVSIRQDFIKNSASKAVSYTVGFVSRKRPFSTEPQSSCLRPFLVQSDSASR